jgi:hypothetical protein
MAQGKPIFTDVSQGSWHPVTKDTVMNTVMEIACAKDEGQSAEYEFKKSEILEEMKH